MTDSKGALVHTILIELILICSAAVIMVPLFRYFNLGAILAYLVAGILIGPGLLGLIKDTETILHFSELGVVFLLFIIGLELAPNKLWNLRKAIFGFGLLQVLLTGTAITFIGTLLGFSLAESYIFGFGLSLSSTAFAIQILEEKRQLNTNHGQGAFAVLMFQDIAVVPIIASLSFFASEGGKSLSLLDVSKLLGFIVFTILLGVFIVRHILRFIANSRTSEVFIAASLLLVLGTAVAAEAVGLSMGMGAFLAGVLLANSEYRHELESNLQPFKGLLLGLFFIAVGMSLKLNIMINNIGYITVLSLALIILKSSFIYWLGLFFKYPKESSRNMAFTIFQGGEFAFVIFSVAIGKNLIEPETASILNSVVILSMILTPFLFTINQKLLRKSSEINERPYDTITSEESDVIIAGFGRFGQIVSRVLALEGMSFTILEHSALQVETARTFGNKVYYGDASKTDILESAGAKDAKIFILAIDDVEKSIETAKTVKTNFPHLKIIARSRNRTHSFELMKAGVENIHRETYLTSLEVAKEALLIEGLERNHINNLLRDFRQHDEQLLKDQFKHIDDTNKFVSFTIEGNKRLFDTLKADKTKADKENLKSKT